MKKKTIHALCKIIMFLMCGIAMYSVVNKTLQRAKDEQWDTGGIERIYKNQYDFIFAGTSKVICNINVEDLYLKYGMASVTVGEPSQPIYLTYYTLENALKKQTPKAVLLDVSALFYSLEKIKSEMQEDEYHYVHFSIDEIKDYRIKYQALLQAKELDEELDMWNYIIPIYYNHSNWENISKSNFVRTSGKYVMNGNLLLTNIDETWKDWTVIQNDNTVGTEIIEKINLKYLEKIVELCRTNNTELVLIQGSANISDDSLDRYNVVQNLARQYDLEYIDLNDHNDEIGINWATDGADMNHLNIVGSQKWTDYIGTYLSEKYEYTDYRTTDEQIELKQNAEKYEKLLDVMNDKIALLRAINLNQYVDVLYNLNKEENVIFISVYDDASINFTDNVKRILSNIGFNIDIKGKYQWSYYGVLENGKLVVERTSRFGIEKEGQLDNQKSYIISSGGALSDKNSSIIIDGIEYGQCGRGINVVVYNKEYDEILSSVYFDTYATENPSTARIVDGIKQLEKEINLWENE